MDKKKAKLFARTVKRLAKQSVDAEVKKIMDTTEGNYSKTDALCYGFSTRLALRVMDQDSKDFGKAVAMQATTLACAIDSGALDKDYIYNSYLSLALESMVGGKK